MSAARVPRPLHPLAWWAWAIGLATAASHTTNLLLLALLVAAAIAVVQARRPARPWALGLRAYLILALLVIGVRVVARALLAVDVGPTVLVRLPEIPLPDVAAGIRIGGPISAEGLVAAVQDGGRLAALLLCVGAANLLADPRRLLAQLPAALHEVGTTVVVALTVAPQLVESLQRVRLARRLRGGAAQGWRGLRATLLPVLEDALDRSLSLAAAMDGRGYGRSAHVPAARRRATAALLLGGLVGLCTGLYGLLDGTAPPVLGLPALGLGALAAAAGTVLAGRRVVRTRHRPDRWRAPESVVALAGAAAGALVVVAARLDVAAAHPSAMDLAVPPLHPLVLPAVLLALLPAVAAPPPVGGTAGGGAP